MAHNTDVGVITTRVPARLDRLPWARFHWRVVIGLGGVWILDGLEVTMVGNVASRLTEQGSGITISAGQIGVAAAFYIAGACLGALVFGQLTDRFGRKKLFMLTLALYLVATVATAFSFAPWYFFAMRFLTGAGIGGEYAAINSAIDELIPARARGRVDLAINGSYWLGAAAGAVGALLLLDTDLFPLDVGWRIAFGIGAAFGLVVLVVRRNVPESPRWLFIHGREDEAERIVDGIEGEVERETQQALSQPAGSMTVQPRKTISFREIARVAFTRYPRRAILGLALFIGQAFMYNGVTFNLGTLLSDFYGVASGTVPLFFILWAMSNFAGPLVLGRLFDTVGRKPMISLSYLGSAAIAVGLAAVFLTAAGGVWTFLAVLMVCFFLASAGASAAYLTVSEIFPMETRALAIAFFYAVGTAIGGITGPLLFGALIGSGQRSLVAVSFLIGAAVMAIGGVVEIFLGVNAEGRGLEDIAEPLTAASSETTSSETTSSETDSARTDRQRREASGLRRYRPGPSQSGHATWLSPVAAEQLDAAIDHEIDMIARAVRERGELDLAELQTVVGARYCWPGEFRRAVREALRSNQIRRAGRRRVGPVDAGPPR